MTTSISSEALSNYIKGANKKITKPFIVILKNDYIYVFL